MNKSKVTQPEQSDAKNRRIHPMKHSESPNRRTVLRTIAAGVTGGLSLASLPAVHGDDLHRAAVTSSDLRVSNATPTLNDVIYVSATVTNDTNIPRPNVQVALLVDGQIEDSKAVRIPASSSTRVSFSVSFDEYESFDVSIGDIDPTTVTVKRRNIR